MKMAQFIIVNLPSLPKPSVKLIDWNLRQGGEEVPQFGSDAARLGRRVAATCEIKGERWYQGENENSNSEKSKWCLDFRCIFTTTFYIANIVLRWRGQQLVPVRDIQAQTQGNASWLQWDNILWEILFWKISASWLCKYISQNSFIPFTYLSMGNCKVYAKLMIWFYGVIHSSAC